MSSRSFDQSGAPEGREFLPQPLPTDPFPLFVAWFNDAAASKLQPNPNAFSLATIDPDGRPSVRIVLCKGIDPRAGSIEFFTNYTGRKGVALDANPRAAACFHWDAADRQVRIEGPVVRCSAARSDEYFASRPWESRIGAWASDQSRPIASRAQMESRIQAAIRRFGLDPAHPPDAAVSIPRPPHWGGFQIHAERVELWVCGSGRVHDRAAWMRSLTPRPPAFALGSWSATRLQP